MPPHRGEQLLHVIEIANNVRVRYILSTSGYHPDAPVNAQARPTATTVVSRVAKKASATGGE